MELELKVIDIKIMLKKISGGIQKNSKKHMLSYILIKTIKNKVFYISINEEIEIVAYKTLKYNVDDCSILIKYDLINNICRTSKNDSIIKFKKNKNSVEIVVENCTFLSQTIDEQIFPSFTDNLLPLTCIRVKAYNLKNLLTHSSIVILGNNPRLFLNGALLTINKNIMYALSSDGFRLVFSYIFIEEQGDLVKIILPKSAINEVINIFEDDYIDILIFENQVKFISSNLALTSKLINDTYYNSNLIINYKDSIRITLKKFFIQNALEKISIFCTNTSKINLKLKDNILSIKVKNNYECAKTTIKTQYKFLNMEITIIYKYLMDILKIIKSDEFEMIITKNEKIIIIKEKKYNYIYVIMPFNS